MILSRESGPIAPGTSGPSAGVTLEVLTGANEVPPTRLTKRPHQCQMSTHWRETPPPTTPVSRCLTEPQAGTRQSSSHRHAPTHIPALGTSALLPTPPHEGVLDRESGLFHHRAPSARTGPAATWRDKFSLPRGHAAPGSGRPATHRPSAHDARDPGEDRLGGPGDVSSVGPPRQRRDNVNAAALHTLSACLSHPGTPGLIQGRVPATHSWPA